MTELTVSIQAGAAVLIMANPHYPLETQILGQVQGNVEGSDRVMVTYPSRSNQCAITLPFPPSSLVVATPERLEEMAEAREQEARNYRALADLLRRHLP